MATMTNPGAAAAPEKEWIAASLRQAAQLLEAQGANPFRVSAYRHAADTVHGYRGDLRALFQQQGLAGLSELPRIGAGIAAAIGEMLQTGHWGQLERLRGSIDPVHLFQTIPGIGPRLADRLHDELHVDTLEGLEVAAYDGRLEKVPGVRTRRAAAVRAALSAMLQRSPRRAPAPASPAQEPTVAVLLDVDREYRDRASKGSLPTIAPRRFNPDGVAWLPVLHTERGSWHFTLLFSNTARAHELDRTHDWVVVYFYDGEHVEGQRTVVTETRGRLAGRRVVRGREAECTEHYADRSTTA
jgi:Holliday junction resolvasome RuvABC DNA-binding subunit